MPTLVDTKERLALNQSSREPTLEWLSEEKLIFWQGLSATVECALFSDTPEAASLVDISNLQSANIIVRKNGPTGPILFAQEVTSFNQINYSNWVDGTARHFAFAISELDTTQIVPTSGSLPIYFVVTAVTQAGVPYIAGFGYGEIVDVGFIENPASVDYVTGRTPIVGGKLLTDLDLNGYRLLDPSNATEAGEVNLTNGQLEGDVAFTFEKLDPTNLRFARKYIKDTATPPQVLEVVVGEITSTGFHFYVSAPATATCTLVWKVEPKDQLETIGTPAPRYGIMPLEGEPAKFKIWDKGGQFFNVAAYGAALDDAAFVTTYNAAVAAGGGTIFWLGKLSSATGLVVMDSNIHLVGAGTSATVLECSLAVQKGIRLGYKGTTNGTSSSVNKNSVSNLAVTRVGGTIPVNCAGIAWECFNYGEEHNVLCDRHYYSRSFEGGVDGISCDWHGVNCYAMNATRAYVWIKGAAGVTFTNPQFGRNGGEAYNPVYCIEISGEANAVTFTDGEVIPRSSGSPRPAVIGFTNYTNATGVFCFNNFNCENVGYGIVSDSGTPNITELKIIGGRWALAGTFFNLNAATTLRFSGFCNTQIANGINLVNPSYVRVVGCELGATTLASPGGEGILTFIGNNCVDNLTITGSWGKLRGVEPQTNTVQGSYSNTAIGDIRPIGIPFSVTTRVSLTAVGGTNLPLVVPAGLKFICLKVVAVIAVLSGFNGSVVPAFVIDSGGGTTQLASSSNTLSMSLFNAVNQAAVLNEFLNGAGGVAATGSTLRCYVATANTSSVLMIDLILFGSLIPE